MRAVNITRSFSSPYRFQPPFVDDSYALLLYVAADDVSPEEQAKISEEIVASGCRFAVCYGYGCSTWDDSIDLASIDAGKEEKEFVMTTWHEDDTPEDVAHYFWHNTSFDSFSAERMGVFILGARTPVESAIQAAIAALNEEKKANPQ